MKKFVVVTALAFFSVILLSSGAFAGDKHHGHHKKHHGRHHGGHHGYSGHRGGHHGGGHHLFHDSMDYLLAPPRYRYREYREPVCYTGRYVWGYDDYGRRMRHYVRGYCE